MSGDWNEQLERRSDGLVPGYVGNNDQAAPASAITGNLEAIVSGLAAARPAANSYKGWYFSTDTGALDHSDGAAWTAVQSGTSGAGLTSAEFLFTEIATVSTTTYAITAVDTTGGKFTVAGDHRSLFPVGAWFSVTDSTGNNGSWPVYDVQFVGGNTVVTTDPISNPTAAGVLHPPYLASLTLPAGSVLDDIRVFLIAPWAADATSFAAGTEDGSVFYNGFGMESASGFAAYDVNAPKASGTGQNYYQVTGDGLGADNAGKGAATFHKVAGSSGNVSLADSFNGPGARFATETILQLSQVTFIASPPVVPTGIALVKVTYWPPVTPTPAVSG